VLSSDGVQLTLIIKERNLTDTWCFFTDTRQTSYILLNGIQEVRGSNPLGSTILLIKSSGVA
jgi:hypothetical protein